MWGGGGQNYTGVFSDVRQTSTFVFKSAESDQSIRCPQVETLHPWIPKMHPVKILIRLRECNVNLRWVQMSGGTFSDVSAHLVCLAVVICYIYCDDISPPTLR